MNTLIQPAYAEIQNEVVPKVNLPAPQFVNSTISLLFTIFLIVGVLYFAWHLVFAGFHLIGSQGDPKAFETAKNELTNSFIGLAVVLSVFAVLRVIGVIFGFDALNITLPTL